MPANVLSKWSEYYTWCMSELVRAHTHTNFTVVLLVIKKGYDVTAV